VRCVFPSKILPRRANFALVDIQHELQPVFRWRDHRHFLSTVEPGHSNIVSKINARPCYHVAQQVVTAREAGPDWQEQSESDESAQRCPNLMIFVAEHFARIR